MAAPISKAIATLSKSSAGQTAIKAGSITGAITAGAYMIPTAAGFGLTNLGNGGTTTTANGNKGGGSMKGIVILSLLVFGGILAYSLYKKEAKK